MKKHHNKNRTDILVEDEIRSVLRIQSRSISDAVKFIGEPFRKAVALLNACRGKVIVTGVGKSGLVAQKIASTMASTGTPAIFLHPVEALHGDLGVVHRNDVVIAIGKSGESEELLKILPSIRKIGAKLVSLTADRASSLARASDIVLHMPIRREACPLNLAPTTSTTVAMVIGDAIAIALMKLRGFGPEHFALFHPGGLLGRRLLLKVSDVMRSGRRNPVVGINESVQRCIVEITDKWTGAASVVDRRGRLVGIVTDFDIRKAFASGRTVRDIAIREIMNPRPTFVRADQKAVEALRAMEGRKKPITVLPVIDRAHRAVGMIHLHDLVAKGLASARDSDGDAADRG